MIGDSYTSTTATRGMHAVIFFDRVQMAIDRDRDVYARWSNRARLTMLMGRPTTPLEALQIRRAGHPEIAKRWRARGPKIEKYVRRAVPGAFVKAMRSEMRGLIDDMAAARFDAYWRQPSRLQRWWFVVRQLFRRR